MVRKLKTLPIATIFAAGLMIVPLTGGQLSAGSGLFGVSPALAGNGNGGGAGGGNAGGHGGGHGGGLGHGATVSTDKTLKTSSKGGKSDTSHGHGFGIAQSFVDTVGRGVGKASSSVQSMFDGVFGRGHTKGAATASVETTPEDVPTPTGRPDKSQSVHAELRALSSLERAPEAYVHSQSPLMVAMRQYIQDYGAYQDGTGTTTEEDLQAELASIVAEFGSPSATQTQTTIDPTTLAETTTITIDPAVADYINGVLGDPSDPTSKFSEIRGMLDSQSSTDTTTETSQTTAN